MLGGSINPAATPPPMSRRFCFVAGPELSLRLPLPAETGSLGKCERTLGQGTAGLRQEMPE